MKQNSDNKNFELKEIKTTSEVEQLDEALLLSLPLEILLYIASYLTPKDKASASQSCNSLYAVFQPDLDKIAAEKLLTYVLQGKGNEVLENAKRNPKLFFIKATAMDYAKDLEGNRRTIEDWSPYQAMNHCQMVMNFLLNKSKKNFRMVLITRRVPMILVRLSWPSQMIKRLFRQGTQAQQQKKYWRSSEKILCRVL